MDDEDSLIRNAEVNEIKAKVADSQQKAKLQEISDDKDRILSKVMKKEDWYHTPYHETFDSDIDEKELSKSEFKPQKAQRRQHYQHYHTNHAHVARKGDDEAHDKYLNKHASHIQSKAENEDDDAIKEAAMEELKEGAKKAEENA